MISSLNFSLKFSKIKIIGKGIEKIVENIPGKSILQIAEENNIHIPDACEGSGACGTCQVYINKGLNKLNQATEQELDILDFAIEPRENSRLSCQTYIQDDSIDYEIEIPKQSRNII